MKKLACIGMFFLSHLLFAEVSEQQAYEALKKDLSRLTKTLTRDIQVYHWFSTNERAHETKKPNDSYFSFHFDYLAKQFFMEGDQNEVGEGFYAALDPQVSTEFGNHLVSVDIKKGTKFLDIRAGHRYGIEVTKKTKSILSQYCWNDFDQEKKVYKFEGQDFISIYKLALTASPQCLVLMNKVVQDLEVEFLTYGWWPTGENFNTCTSAEKGAFILFGKLVSDPKNVDKPVVDLSSFKPRGFVPRPAFRFDQESRDLYANIDQVSRLTRVDYSGTKGTWSFFENLDPWSNTALIKDLSDKRFGCLKETFKEDQVLPFK